MYLWKSLYATDQPMAVITNLLLKTYPNLQVLSSHFSKVNNLLD